MAAAEATEERDIPEPRGPEGQGRAEGGLGGCWELKRRKRAAGVQGEEGF